MSRDTTKRITTKSISFTAFTAIAYFLLVLGFGGTVSEGLTYVGLIFTVALSLYLIYDKMWTYTDWLKTGPWDWKTRSLVKTVLWRVIAITAVVIVTKFVLGWSMESTIKFTIYSQIMSFTIHYIHERVWNLVGWGKGAASPSPASSFHKTS
jgi:uncharacterized membrane protein